MALASVAALRDARRTAALLMLGGTSNVQSGRFATLRSWPTPATTAALTRASAGSLAVPRAGATRVVATRSGSHSSSNLQRDSYMIVDRLVHHAGLDGTVTARQTTGLPTAALPRYTDGAGVWMFLVPWVQIGATQVSAGVEYTNQSGAAKTTSALVGGSAERTVAAMTPVPLASGDRGVRSVEAITLSGSTATAGNFGFVLVRPLCVIPPGRREPLEGTGPLLETLDADAALDLWVWTISTGGQYAGGVYLSED